MSELDIGTIAGHLELEDGFTPALDVAMKALDKAADFLGDFGKIAAGSLVGATAAVTALGTAIVVLGEKGSKLVGVEESFNRLAKAAGSTGDILIGKLSEGVHDTIDGMVLMQAANRALAAGVKLTGDDMKVLGETARAMGKAAGTDAAQELETLFRALSSGQTRLLRMKGLVVDIKDAEDKYAKSIGTTADRLNEAGKREAARLGILEAARKRLDLLGVSQESLAEKVKKAEVAIGNWWDELNKAIERSPQVHAAFDAIVNAFGELGKEIGPKLLDAAINGINMFADGIRSLAPYINTAADYVKNFWGWIVKLNDRFDITGKVISTVHTVFDALVSAVTTVVGWVKTFWNNLVELNDRFDITGKVVSAARAAFSFLQTAFELVKGAAIALVSAWDSIPDWLQKIAAQAVTAGIALMAINTAAGAALNGLGNFISKLDLGLNVVSNFSVAIQALPSFYRNASNALSILTKEILTSSAGMAVMEVVMKSMTAAYLFWLETLDAATAAIAASSAGIAASSIVQAANTVITAGSTAALVVYSDALEFLSATTVVTTARTWLLAASQRGLAVSAALARAGTLGLNVAMVALGTALLAVQYVLIPLTAAFLAFKYGAELGEWVRTQSSTLKTLQDEVGKTIAAYGEYFGLLPEGTTAQYDASAAAHDLALKQRELAGGIDAAAEAQKRLINDLTGKTIAEEVEKLNQAFLSIHKSGLDSADALMRIGEQASHLRERGGELPPVLMDLANWFDEVHKKADTAAGSADKFTKATDTKQALAYAAAIEEQAKAFDALLGQDLIEKGIQLTNQLLKIGEGKKNFDWLKNLPTEQLQNIQSTLSQTIDLMERRGMALPEPMLALYNASVKAGEAVGAVLPLLKNTSTVAKDYFAGLLKMQQEWENGALRTSGQNVLKNTSTVAQRYFKVIADAQDAAKQRTKMFEQSLDSLSQAFAQLGQIAGGAFSTIVSAIGQVISAISLASKAVDAMKGGLAAISAQKTANAAAKAAGGSTGLSGILGMVGGFAQLATGIMAATAAAIQFGKALYDALTKSRPEQLMESVFKDFGEKISEDTGKLIDAQAKSIYGGSYQAAQIGNLDKIIQEGGGVTAQNLTRLEARLHDVFSMMETGQMTAAQGQDVLNKNFMTFVDFLGGKVNPALKEIIRLNDKFGTQSKAIAAFLDAESNKALGALGANIAARGGALDAVDAAQKDLAEAKKHGKKSDITKAQETLQKAQDKLAALPLTQAGAQAEGASLFGIFDRLTKDGGSFVDVLTQMQPIIDTFQKQLDKAGYDGGAAFGKLKAYASIATDEIAGPAFSAIQNYGSALEALNNADLLTQETFSGLTEQISATYKAAQDALIKQGKDGALALDIITPQLQQIWELEQDFGYAADDATQKLIDQAVEAGKVGEKHRSVQEQTLDVMKHLDDVLTAIGTKFGVTLPDQIDKTGQAFTDAGRNLQNDLLAKIPDNVHIPVKLDYPEGPDDRRSGPSGSSGPPSDHAAPMALGGLVYAASGFWVPRGTDTVRAMLTPGEFVVPAPIVSAVGAKNVIPALTGGGSFTRNAPWTGSQIKSIADLISQIPSSGGRLTTMPIPHPTPPPPAMGSSPIVIIPVKGGSKSTSDVDQLLDMLVRAAPSIARNRMTVKTKLLEALGEVNRG